MSTRMTPDRVNDIRTRELLATRGPWGLYDSEDGFVDIAADLKENGTGYNCRRSIAQLEADLIDNDPAHADWSEGEEREQVLADAEFIAHAREDVPALLAEVDRLRAELTARRRQVTPVEAFAYDMDQALVDLSTEERRGADLVLQVLRARATAADVPTTEGAS